MQGTSLLRPLSGLLALAVIAFHAAWLTAPLSMQQLNAAQYFGVFTRNWERFGFFDLRGLPLMDRVVEHIGQGAPYVHHPPGLSWLFHALGGAEWSMRLPTVIASYLAGLCWYRIARVRFTKAASAFSAAVLVFCPCMAVVSQASYEVLVVMSGLVVFAELVAPVSPRWLSRTLQLAAAFFGTWIDWGFGFLGIACIPLACRSDVRTTFTRLLPAGIAAVSAMVTVLLWQHWALALPGLTPVPRDDSDFGAMFRRFVFGERTGFWWWLGHMRATAPLTWSGWLIGTGALGIGFALVRAPRLTLATAIVAVAPFVILVRPMDYVWHTFQSPFLALTAAAALDPLLRCARRELRLCGWIAGAVLLGGVMHASWQLRADDATAFFERQGRTLSEVAAQPGWAAAHNHPLAMPYYLTEPRVERFGLYLPEQLAPLVAQRNGHGWKYLLCKPVFPGLVPPQVETFLAPFPRVRVPELEGPLDRAGNALTGGIAEAWLYTLSEPPR
jgi:hypothetical protein